MKRYFLGMYSKPMKKQRFPMRMYYYLNLSEYIGVNIVNKQEFDEYAQDRHQYMIKRGLIKKEGDVYVKTEQPNINNQ